MKQFVWCPPKHIQTDEYHLRASFRKLYNMMCHKRWPVPSYGSCLDFFHKLCIYIHSICGNLVNIFYSCKLSPLLIAEFFVLRDRNTLRCLTADILLPLFPTGLSTSHRSFNNCLYFSILLTVKGRRTLSWIILLTVKPPRLYNRNILLTVNGRCTNHKFLFFTLRLLCFYLLLLIHRLPLFLASYCLISVSQRNISACLRNILLTVKGGRLYIREIQKKPWESGKIRKIPKYFADSRSCHSFLLFEEWKQNR